MADKTVDRVKQIQALIEYFTATAAVARQPPGDGYRERLLEVEVWDHCDAGGEGVAGAGFTFEEGDAELVIAGLRALVDAPGKAIEAPLAWAVFVEDDPLGFDYFVYPDEEKANRCAAEHKTKEVVPLYRLPSGHRILFKP